jgi:hypothetical protein
LDGVDSTLTYAAGPLLDRLTSQASSADTLLDETWGYDADGRVTRVEQGHYLSTDAVHRITWAYGPNAAVAADEVFRSATVNGAAYEYFRDALGRRRAKIYPTGAKDEYFYGLTNELLTDVGVGSVAAIAGPYMADDYVWLGGRPVAMVRGKLDQAVSTRCGKDLGQLPGCRVALDIWFARPRSKSTRDPLGTCKEVSRTTVALAAQRQFAYVALGQRDMPAQRGGDACGV